MHLLFARSRRAGRLASRLCTIVLAASLSTAPAFGAAPQPPTDEAVAEAVRSQYMITPTVDLNRIGVSVAGGVVHLTGTVSNLLAKERAAQLAEIVAGVRSVVNQIRVQPSTLRSDASIRESVIAALLSDPAADSYEIDVSVEDNTITLKGAVNSWAERDLAETVAKGVDGAIAVDNLLTIDYSAPRSDAEIEAEIVERLRWDVLVDDGLLEVAVADGKVTLEGTVGSAAEKRRAWFDAWVNGVKSVDDSGVEVSWLVRDERVHRGKYAPKTDAAISEAVKDALAYDPRVLSFVVDVAVNNGIVTLGGTVDNLGARKAADQVTRNTVGVVAVTNNIKVRSDALRTDEQIRQDIRNRLLSNSTTESYEIGVRVEDGVVTLSGKVDNAYELGEAMRVAENISGVSDVRNWLEVASGEGLLPRYNPYPGVAPYLGITRIPRSDARLQDDIRTQLTWSPFVDADRIFVEVDNGRVTLTGMVDTWREYRAAEENAYEGGAVSVDNQLQVIHQTPTG